MKKSVVATSIAVALQACGGGSGTGNNSNNEASIPNQGALSTEVVFDNNIPKTTRDVVESIVSPFTTKSINSQLTVATPASTGESIVLGLNSKGDIVLAALATTSKTTLSNSSTALALVRMILGPLPEGITSEQANRSITQTKEFSDLISLVSKETESSSSPALSSDVMDGIKAVLYKVSTSFAEILQPNDTTRETAKSTIAERRVERPLPFAMLEHEVLPYKFPISVSGGSSGSITVTNSTPIFWYAKTFPTAAEKEKAIDEKLIPGNSIKNILLGAIHGWASNLLLSTELATNAGYTTNIRLEQTIQSRAENLSKIYKDAISLIFSALPSDCSSTFAKQLIGQSEIMALAEKDTMDGFFQYMKAIMDNLKVIDAVKLKSCLPKEEAVPDSATKWVSAFSALLATYKLASKASDAYSLGAKVVMTNNYWTYSNIFGACRSGNTIVSCASRFEFDPNPMYLMIGDLVKPTIKSFDAKNQNTLSPADEDLVFWPGSGTKVAYNYLGGGLIAAGVGSDNVRVTENGTGAEGSFTVNVIKPIITPNPIKLKQNEVGFLYLTNPYNGEHLAPPSEITWSVSDSNYASLETPQARGMVAIKGKSKGTTKILVNAAGYDDPITADVIIDPLFNIAPITSSIKAGQTTKLNITDQQGNLVTIPGLVWSSSNSKVTVDSSGVVAAAQDATGDALITATDPASGYSVNATVSIIKTSSIFISLSQSNYGGSYGTIEVYFDGKLLGTSTPTELYKSFTIGDLQVGTTHSLMYKSVSIENKDAFGNSLYMAVEPWGTAYWKNPNPGNEQNCQPCNGPLMGHFIANGGVAEGQTLPRVGESYLFDIKIK